MSESRQPGFLHRWSRRKIDAREGGVQEDAPAPKETVLEPAPAADVDIAPVAQAEGQPAEPVLPTMADVQGLTSDSDFSRFVVQGVSPDVKNAALKKLFADPHYNVMDGLDTYIDDYSQLAPLPESELRKMAVAKVFGFFEEEARCAAAAATQGEQACIAPERGSETRADNAATPDADDAVVSALPAPADPPAGLADLPAPAARAKP